MKKIVIWMAAAALAAAPAGALAAEDGGARLSGVYSSHNEIKVIADDIQSVEWLLSRSETGTYNSIDGESGETYRISLDDEGYWLKAAVTDSDGNRVETEPRQIEEEWTTRRQPGDIGGAAAQTPEKFIFTVGGMDFVLLDVTEDEESKFLAVTENNVGYRPISAAASTQYFYDITGFLNSLDEVTYYYNSDEPQTNQTGYSQTGYIGNSAYTQLPQGVLDAINYSHVWKSEPTSTGQAKERCYMGGITIPSYTDMERYADRIGWKNDVSAGDANNFIDFWLRTPSRTSGQILYAYANVAGRIEQKAIDTADMSVAIRPMFYLERDFFINNKPESAGQEVLNAMWAEYSKEELLTIYTQEELTALGYIDFTIDSLSAASDAEGCYAEVTISSRLGESRDIVVLAAAYDAEGMLVGVNISTLACVPGENNVQIRLHGATADNYSSAMAVIIDSAENPAPIYKAVFTQ